MQRSGTISTWNRSPADEDAMGASHAPIWRRMIDVSVPDDLRDSTILDYGCNQGGFAAARAASRSSRATSSIVALAVPLSMAP